MSPTQRSIAKLKADGWLVAIVEKFNPFVKVRQDLFGFADLLAIKGDVSLYVQTTSGSNVSAHVTKIKEHPNAAIILASPTRQIVVHGWAKRGPRGKRKLWECREVFI